MDGGEAGGEREKGIEGGGKRKYPRGKAGAYVDVRRANV